jgi:hypothetical protein
MEEKEFVLAILTAQWEMLQRGRNTKFRFGRFRDSMTKHLALKELQVNTFYTMGLMKHCLLIY